MYTCDMIWYDNMVFSPNCNHIDMYQFVSEVFKSEKQNNFANTHLYLYAIVIYMS